jgi:hypothetical protein
VGKSPFSGNFKKEVYGNNKECSIIFDDPRILLLSQAGIVWLINVN